MKLTRLILILIGILLIGGCGLPNDPIPDDLYTKNIYPGGNDYQIGTEGSPYRAGYFQHLYVENETLYIGGVPFVNGDGLESHTITGEYHIFSETPEGKFLKDDGTWATTEGAMTEGSMAVHGNEYHNPDFTTQADIDSLIGGHEADFTHSDIALNTTGRHSHNNKTILDNTQESFTTTLKNAYDAVSGLFTQAWKTTVDNFIGSKGQANGLAPLDASSKVPTANLGSAGADNTKFLRGDQTWAAPAGGGGESEQIVILASNVANSTTTLANANGLSFAADAYSTYLIEGFIVWNTSATSVGIKLSATGPSSPVIMSGHFITDAASGTPDSSSFNANNAVVTTSASAFTTGNIGALHCILKTNANSGTFQITFAAETTGTITMQAGSVLRYRKVA